ncbi:VOC family protein [soil metagenome]
MKTVLVPYLNFNGTTREAMTFYQSILGGKLTFSTFGESGAPVSDSEKDNIMHADLSNDTLSFMASDGNAHQQVIMGNNVHMSIVGTDEAKISEYFNKLGEGGKIDMPLEKQVWGDMFGMLTDKFGVHWMVNISSGQPQK